MTPDWIAVDWGTSNLRAWAMGSAGILATAQSEAGMSKLARGAFEAALLDLIAPWLGAGGRVTPVVACGMVGSRQGWHEAPYRAVPCTPLDIAAMTPVPVADSRITLRIAPGLKQLRPADVMRGEETQIAGALAVLPAFDGVFCLPGTHSKWAHISAGEVVSFQTFMTGELFALLSGHSVLRHSMPGEGWDDAGFDQGLDEGCSHPQTLSSGLFTLRAQSLIAGLSPGAARARLSGLLIGAELAAARPYWQHRPIALIGAATLSAIYARALSRLGQDCQCLDATLCTLSGLARAQGSLRSAAE